MVIRIDEDKILASWDVSHYNEPKMITHNLILGFFASFRYEKKTYKRIERWED